MSTPCRIDSPIPTDLQSHLLRADSDAFAFGAPHRTEPPIDREDGARTPRASSRSSLSASPLPSLRLPVCQGTPPRSHLGRTLGPVLAQHLMQVSPTRSETYISLHEMDGLLQDIWLAGRPEALQALPMRVRLLRPEDDVALYFAIAAQHPSDSMTSAEDFAYILSERLRNQHYTIVAEHDGAFIATASLLLQSRLATHHEYVGNVDDFFVAPKWHEARLGPAIINVLMTFGDKLGVAAYAVAYDWQLSQGPHC